MHASGGSVGVAKSDRDDAERDVDEKAERTRTSSATTTADVDEWPRRRHPVAIRTPSAAVKSLVLFILPRYVFSRACCILVMSMAFIYACLIVKIFW